jgi:succinoglycan biosynthesis transport protein ExoP
MNALDAVSANSGYDLIDLPDLMRILGRYRWNIVGIMLLTVAATALYAFSAKPFYLGTVAILIESRSQNIVQGQDVYDPGAGTVDYYGTQKQILISRELAEHAVDRLKLVDNPEFSDEIGVSKVKLIDFRKYLPFLPPEEAPLQGEAAFAQKREAVIQTFMDRLQVETIEGTQVINVHFKAHSPELAAQAANTVADLFLESGLQAKLDATRKATAWLTEKLADIKSQLAKSEANLQAYREKEQIVSVSSGARTLTESELVDYSQRLREAQKKRTELESAYEKVQQVGRDTRKLREINAVLLDPLVQKASTNMLAAQEDLKQAQERYGAKHPLMVKAQTRLDTATAAFDDQLRIAADGLKTEFEIAKQNERAIAQQVETTRNKTMKLDRNDYQLSVLQREVETNRELFDTFLSRFKETDTGSSFQSLSARIIDPAVPSKKIYEPRIKRLMAVSAFVGLLIGLFLALLRHLLSEEIHTAEDLERLNHLPVLSVLPLVRGLLGGKRKPASLYLEHLESPFAEGIRSIRTALQLSDVDRRFKRIMVTSSVPQEGKSSISSALAFAMAANEQVLLVDADLRRPTQAKSLSLPIGAKGLTDALRGEPLEECLHKHEQGGIWVMPAGARTTNPSEMISSEAFSKLLQELSGRFDRIILDSPPCQAASDALLLADQVNTVLFVVKSDATSRRAIKNSLKRLEYARAPILGNVINLVDARRNREYRDSYRYVYSYYGK